jgi:hypothetical protein
VVLVRTTSASGDRGELCGAVDPLSCSINDATGAIAWLLGSQASAVVPIPRALSVR